MILGSGPSIIMHVAAGYDVISSDMTLRDEEQHVRFHSSSPKVRAVMPLKPSTELSVCMEATLGHDSKLDDNMGILLLESLCSQ